MAHYTAVIKCHCHCVNTHLLFILLRKREALNNKNTHTYEHRDELNHDLKMIFFFSRFEYVNGAHKWQRHWAEYQRIFFIFQFIGALYASINCDSHWIFINGRVHIINYMWFWNLNIFCICCIWLSALTAGALIFHSVFIMEMETWATLIQTYRSNQHNHFIVSWIRVKSGKKE